MHFFSKVVTVLMDPEIYQGREGGPPVSIRLVRTGQTDTSVDVCIVSFGGTATGETANINFCHCD